MSYRKVEALLALFLATFCVTALAPAQDRSTPGHGAAFGDPFGDSDGSGRITGTVRTADGHAVANANVEARDIDRGTQQASGRTDSRGSFALYNISPGTYDVTVTAGVNEAHERVQVASMSGDASVDFRLADRSLGAPKTTSGSTVSLAQYQVPAKARSLFEKANQCMMEGKLDESAKKVNAALAVFPKFPEALTLRGMLQFAADKQAEAIADFQQAIEYDASYAVAYIGLGSALNSTGRFNESLPILGQAERLAPNAWQTYFELARTHIGRQEFAIALRNTDRALELQGGQERESPELHLVRGYALLGLAQIPRAMSEIEAFLARRPNGRISDAARDVLKQLHETAATTSK
jgi:tetratricopeptide (TPR) repeat protein